MNQSIRERITALGGTFHFQGKTLQDNIQSIHFPVPLIIKDFYSFCDELEKFKTTNKQLFEHHQALFFKNAVQHFYSPANTCYTNIRFEHTLFTPFTKGTKDYEEWDIEEAEVRVFIDDAVLEFMFIGNTDGFPNHYFICLSDKSPHNPMVYSTDHETYFWEIKKEGTLEEFFQKFLTPSEFLEVIKQVDNPNIYFLEK
ncbi:hypothetical protein [Microscilla marina]|uniref:Uncharacterized protein n=1 Tax=Microscilla marina ATCC 23134 TaxID=313606 RepID=A1ZRN4_MICM2|nr:hypothetical protein [Microscilla marina]EAY26939.1 conserved hypothetical protein [Microscilla marina ATCC 23134]